MRHSNSEQLEIFSLDDTNLKDQKQTKTFINFIWNYEKTILLIIAFVIVGVVTFSLGFEKGKRAVSSKSGNIYDITKQENKMQQNIDTLHEEKEVIKDIENKKTKETLQRALAKEHQESYTIQVATYRSKTSAQREAQFLKNKGLQTLVFSKGNYIQLCVGKFLSKEEAKLSFQELKKRYQDCFIRKL